jgi:hypothetical protein
MERRLDLGHEDLVTNIANVDASAGFVQCPGNPS